MDENANLNESVLKCMCVCVLFMWVIVENSSECSAIIAKSSLSEIVVCSYGFSCSVVQRCRK